MNAACERYLRTLAEKRVYSFHLGMLLFRNNQVVTHPRDAARMIASALYDCCYDAHLESRKMNEGVFEEYLWIVEDVMIDMGVDIDEFADRYRWRW